MGEQSCADRGDLAVRYRAFLVRAEGLVEIPAVEVWAIERCADMEVRFERGDDPRERVQVRAVFADELVCARLSCGSERAPLSQPPLGGPPVEGGDVELVHHQHAAGLEQLREALEGSLERLDVVERGDGERRGERAGRLCQLVQRDRTNICTARRRVDREHGVSGLRKRTRKRAVTGANLEQARRRRRQVRADESQQIRNDYSVTVACRGGPLQPVDARHYLVTVIGLLIGHYVRRQP
jgi:hypothetical protein